MKFSEKFFRFMYGRYGMYGLDKFTVLTFALYLIITLLSVFIGNFYVRLVLSVFQTFLFAYWLFRFFSRNIAARRKEDAFAAKIVDPVWSFLKLQNNRFKDRKTHVYRKCPKCKAVLRLPKRKGKNTVKCPRCAERFQVKG